MSPQPFLSGLADAGVRRSLTADLEALLEYAGGDAITLGGAMDVLRDRGTAMVMVLATLPCVVPGVAAAFAIPVGTAITLYGLRLMFLQKPLLPGFLGRRTLSYPMLRRLVTVAVRFGRPIEQLLRPRLVFMSSPPMRVVTGLAIAFCGFFMALPLLIPFSNEIPAAVILILLVGVIERDGLFLIVGLLLTLVLMAASVYLCVLVGRYGLKGGLHMVRALVRHHRAPATTAASQAG